MEYYFMLDQGEAQAYPGQAPLEALVLGVIMVFAFVGNGMVLFIVYKNPKMRKTTNYFICNLALADIVFASWIPFIIVTRVIHQWIFGNIVCKMLTYVQFVSGISSILTLMMISIERFFNICLLQGRKMTKQIAVIVIITTWVLASCFPVPIAWAQLEKTIIINQTALTYCGIEWPEHFHIDVYLSFMVTFFFAAPLGVIIINYYKIFKVVRMSSRRTGRLSRSEIRTRRKFRLTKMFVTIVVAFIIMWSPFFIVSFLAVYLNKITSTQFTITIILALANTGQNPVIYGFFNKKFRSEFRNICNCEKEKPVEVSKKYVSSVNNQTNDVSMVTNETA